MLNNEFPTRFHFVPHQGCEHFVGFIGVGDLDLQQSPRVGIQRGFPQLIGIHFPEGGIAMDKEGCFFRQSSVAMPENEIISAVGAGDAFASGLMFGFLDGWETARSMRLAVANAAVSLLSDTTTGSIKPWRDALDFADARGFRSQP